MLITSLQESKMDQEFSSRWLVEFNTDIKFDKYQMKLEEKNLTLFKRQLISYSCPFKQACHLLQIFSVNILLIWQLLEIGDMDMMQH